MSDPYRELRQGVEVTTTDGQPPDPQCAQAGAPQGIDPASGQHRAYWVLSPQERAKGFVRPVRQTYTHRGRQVCGLPVKDDQPGNFICTCEPNHVGGCDQWRQVTDKQLQDFSSSKRLGGCGGTTSMGLAIAETYARNPKFYGSTFCVQCGNHYPVAEFTWFGTEEALGS